MIALTRAVSPSLHDCELTHLDRALIDVDAAERQHAGYERTLASLGCSVVAVPPAPELPDSVFVEDTAVLVDELAIMSRPGAASRRPELGPVADVLSGYRALQWIEEPGTLDGGDVLRVGRTVWVGCLHLKTAVTSFAEDALLVNPEWVEPARLRGYDVVEVDPREPYAANVLRVGGAVLMPAGQPRTRDRLDSAGIRVLEVDVSELAKAEAGVTCCSLVLMEGP